MLLKTLKLKVPHSQSHYQLTLRQAMIPCFLRCCIRQIACNKKDLNLEFE
jgi:hypothetical protein